MTVSPVSTLSDEQLQAAPATRARGYWTTVGRRLLRDKVSVACAAVLLLIFLSALVAPWLGLAYVFSTSGGTTAGTTSPTSR